ncbi:hypothetical protein EJB05_01805 [Eragrostis curvula]|uniref:Cux N-terminal domain-containing protein n=1 Tax=Eragrostis curvula TaxID=38414 RepID=A0A5J9WT23_9POAL|nr:hypothetical protein EJB05_27634 [Eragrostis curvula]TVU50434.1 hypothetical protein EJB05_01805 [Eragrostis curvula]
MGISSPLAVVCSFWKDEKLSLFNSLLKNYQVEIDNLAKRATFGENLFLNIYQNQKLYEGPVPYTALAFMAPEDELVSLLQNLADMDVTRCFR